MRSLVPAPRSGASPAAGSRDTGERGSAAVLATVLIGLLTTVTLMVAVVGGAVTDQRRVESAADLGALAGASAAQHGEDGCAAAGRMVARNRSRLSSCSVAGGVVTVRAARGTRPLLGVRLTVTSDARAGPAAGLAAGPGQPGPGQPGPGVLSRAPSR